MTSDSTPAGESLPVGKPASRSGAPADANGEEDADLEALRQILIGHYRQRARDLQQELDEVQTQLRAIIVRIEDKQALIDTVTPIMANSIRQSIHDSKDEMVEALYPVMAKSIQSNIDESKDEMVEALYPIVGRLVTRSVSESMRELARRIDEQMRNTFSPKRVGRRVRARVSGVSQAELTLRDALPFAVRRIFLIDRETGILLAYVSDGDENAEDSDIIGGMLTAIRDFVEDAFGRGEEGELDAIRYGDRTILTETAEHTYIAVVTEGIVPSGFLAEIRQQLFQIEERYGKTLRTFDGDIDEVSGAVDYLMPLLAGGRPAQRNATGPIESTVAAERHISNTAAATLAITALLMLATAWWLLRLADAQFP